MRLIRLHTEAGFRIGLAGEPARIYTPVVYIDTPLRLLKIPNGDIERYATDYHGPVKKAARTMLSAGRKLGITKTARKHLRAAL